MKPSARSAIPPFHAMAMNRRAEEREARGLDVFHLEVGQPSTPAPRGVLDAAVCRHRHPHARGTRCASMLEHEPDAITAACTRLTEWTARGG